jgi:hypothetical protein
MGESSKYFQTNVHGRMFVQTPRAWPQATRESYDINLGIRILHNGIWESKSFLVSWPDISGQVCFSMIKLDGNLPMHIPGQTGRPNGAK